MKKAPAKMKKAPAKMKKAPIKKALIGKQANLPKALRDKIMASPATMLKPAAMKMMKKAPVRMMKKSSTKQGAKKSKITSSDKRVKGVVRPDLRPTVDIRKKKNSSKVAENKRQLDSKYNGPRSKGGLSPRKIGSKK